MITGSLAGALYGTERPRMGIDLVVKLRPDQIDEFVGALKADFYADSETIKETLTNQRSFSLIHYGSAFKFDIFPLLEDEHSEAQFGRLQFAEPNLSGEESVKCAFASAEDTILNKLRWYRLGGETSERQWKDLRGIVRIQGATLDQGYLNTWAPKLGVAGLMERLLRGQ
jgi:hypothetical protein